MIGTNFLRLNCSDRTTSLKLREDVRKKEVSSFLIRQEKPFIFRLAQRRKRKLFSGTGRNLKEQLKLLNRAKIRSVSTSRVLHLLVIEQMFNSIDGREGSGWRRLPQFEQSVTTTSQFRHLQYSWLKFSYSVTQFW